VKETWLQYWTDGEREVTFVSQTAKNLSDYELVSKESVPICKVLRRAWDYERSYAINSNNWNSSTGVKEGNSEILSEKETKVLDKCKWR
jgi:hypothetical protein